MAEPASGQQETTAVEEIMSAVPIDVDDLPSDAEASTSEAVPKAVGPGRQKGKKVASTSTTADKDANAMGLESYLLPKSKITKIAKSAIPPNTKLQKEVPTALTRSAVVFISYLTSLAQEQAAAAKVKTIKPEHVLEALPELDWGEADTARLRKDLKKQLKAFRAIAKAKKEGKPIPGPSTTGKPRGRPPKKAAVEIKDDETVETADIANDSPEVNIVYKGKGLLKTAGSGEETSSEDEDDVNVTRIGEDGEDEDAAESAIEDDIEEEEEEEDEQDNDEEDEEIEEADEVDPNDFEDEMGRGLDDKVDERRGEDDMED